MIASRCAIKSIPVFLLLMLNFYILHSQDLDVRYLSREDGLSSNTVTTIFQDHNGFIWFGTYDGLNRYDGYDFKVFRNIIDDSNSIASNNINSIAEDTRHNIWVGGQKEVNIYRPISANFSIPTYTFSNGTTRSRLKDNVVSVQRVKENTILIGTQHNGLFYFDNAVSVGYQVPIIINKRKLVDYYVSAIKYDTAKDITYVLVQNEGLFTYDAAEHTLALKNNTLQQANCIEINKDKLWIGDNSGLYQLDIATNTFTQSLIPYKGPVVNLCHDKKGVLWIATDGGGIWLLPPGESTAVVFSSANSDKKSLINSNAIYSIYEDKDERKWIGTLRGGVNIVEQQQDKFKKIVYQSPDHTSTAENFILSFCEDDRQNVWIGTDGAGLRYWNRVNNTFKNFPYNGNNENAVSSSFITGIINDKTGNGIWVSTWFAGINFYNTKTGLFNRYKCYNPATKRINNNVWTMLQDSRSRIWASAVRNGGLYLLNRNIDSFEIFDSKLAELQCLAEDKNGSIWGGDYTSLIRIDTKNKQHQFHNLGYTIRCIYEDKGKNFWIGTQEGGLVLFNRQDGSFKRFTTTDGLPHNTVLRILEDKEGNLWLSTYNGLSRFDPRTKTFRNFYQSNGLQSNQFSFHGALALSSGELLFGGINGFNIFFPENIVDEKKVPPIFLTSLNINNIPVQNDPALIKEIDDDVIKKVVVPFDKASLSFDYLGLDFSNAANINYAYLLEGWDKNWNYVKNIRTANYSRLGEGSYVFKIRVSYSDGVWSEPRQLLHITVLPPWYRSWWAYGLYALVGIGLIYLYAVYNSRQAKLRYEVQIAHLETQQEKDLNEKKIAFFTNISHEFRTPLSLIINPIKDILTKKDAATENAELKVVYRNAQRLLRLVDQLLLFKKADAETDKLNINKVNFNNLCNDVFFCFSEQARVRKIKYELQFKNESKLELNADREKLEIALFNILSNAFKYTPDGGQIIVTIEEVGLYIRIDVSDTGTGISETDGNKLFERFYQAKNAGSKPGFGIGLYLVRKFVEAHGGSVSYKSKVGVGTTFTLQLLKNTPGTVSLPASGNKAGMQPGYTVPDLVSQNEGDGETNNRSQVEIIEEGQQLAASSLLNEMSGGMLEDGEEPSKSNLPQELTSDRETLLIIDDDSDIRKYLVNVFTAHYKIFEAASAEDGLKLAHKYLPDLIISDIVMQGLNGLDLCRTLKEDATVSHIPIILLTGTSSDAMQLEGMESGADDYIKKPFDIDILVARVKSILKRRTILQNYFYNELTFGPKKFKISDEYKEFLEKCMRIIEERLTDSQFSIKTLATEIGMSHSNLYRKIKAVSGQSVNGFIRFIRLKKAAEIFINTENNVNETALMVGFNDIKYFRAQFVKLYGLNPSEYIKKYRTGFNSKNQVEDRMQK